MAAPRIKRALVGCGGMGGAIAHYWALRHPGDCIVLVDLQEPQVSRLARQLRACSPVTPVDSIACGAEQMEVLRSALQDADVVVLALPWPATLRLLELRALPQRAAVVSITRPATGDARAFEAAAGAYRLVCPCGLEPGLAEILAEEARHGFDRVDEVHVQCGGLSFPANPPLNYRLLFGTHLPLNELPSYAVEEAQVVQIPRYSGIEQLELENVGKLQAFHDGMTEAMASRLRDAGVRKASQKTLRWPGYAEKLSVLRELGFASEKPVALDSETKVAPKALSQALLARHVEPSGAGEDLCILRVRVEGIHGSKRSRREIDLRARAKKELGLSSMAWITGYTAAIAGECLREEPDARPGWVLPEDFFVGDRLGVLLGSLRREGADLSCTDSAIA